MRPPLLGTRVEELLNKPQLPIPAHKRRLQALRPERPRPPGRHAQRAIERHRLGLPLQLEASGAFIENGRFGRTLRRLTDKHDAGISGRLNPACGVDEIARHHPLTLSMKRDRGLPGEDTDARLQVRVELGNRSHEVERRPHRPLSVVLLRNRRPPHRHHRITNELLHRAAIQRNKPAARVEIARQKLTHLLRIPRLRQPRKTNQIREQHRHQTTLSHGRLARLRRNHRCRRRSGLERGATTVTETRFYPDWMAIRA